MRNGRFVRKLAGFLAALTLLQCGAPLTALAAEQESDQIVAEVQQAATPALQNGTAIIPSDATPEQVKEILCQALVSNADEVDAQSLEWEYHCKGTEKYTGLGENYAWGSINGFESQTGSWIKVTYTHPALVANGDGSYQVRLVDAEGNAISDEVTLTKAAKLSSSITLKEGCEVVMPYKADATVDYDALRENVFNAVVDEIYPADITVDDVSIEYEAKSQTTGWFTEWVPFEGESVYPAISEGSQKIRISYAENDEYYGTSAETTVTITERDEAPYTLKKTPDAVTLAVGDDMKVDYALLHNAIFDAVVDSSEVLTADNVTIEYYYKGITELDSKWLALEGQAVVGGLGYPAISAGTQQIRISFAGNQQYAPTTIVVDVQVNDRAAVQINKKDAPYEVGMKFNAEQGYDYAATAKAIYEAVVASTEPAVSYDQATVEYNADPTGITDSFKSLDWTGSTGLLKFGTGDWEIRISVADTKDYKGNSVIVKVTTTDSREASTVALKEGVSFTYNMDVNAMKQAIFDNVIDWDNSTLPAKETLSIDNFTIEYKAKLTDIESGVDLGIGDLIDSDMLTQWVPIEGKVYSIGDTILGQYPQMGAGENQQIRVSYKGNADFRPSDNAEGNVTVNKAKVSVKVNSTNIYVEEGLPENFITLDPNDKFDLYTIYAGVTSNVTTGIYLDLPDRYTDSAFLKVLDPVVEAIYGKTFTQMMNDGVTVGELRQLLSTQELLDLLDKLNIDTGTFGQILTVINKLPGVLDSVRISFGTPNRAGLYTVAVVTDSKNYETGVGIGFLLVKMHFSGAKLVWNQEITGGKLTAEQAKTFDFGATLGYNGDMSVDQDSVHYLYSGFTSKWKVYSSTTTPPTEPGRYVVTVCILGGNYMAAPITRSFQITK